MNEPNTSTPPAPHGATAAEQQSTEAAKWRPLSARQRRVAGVLIEKARTTPDAYPLSLNALTTGCNQKSNRHPQMHLKPDEVEDALDQLREMGAVAEVHSGGRVAKYRHYMYEWLGVDKHELAIMAELLLRGDQTLGELRARASRMEPISDLTHLKQLLDGLVDRGLVVALTPPGRGQVVTHGLYTQREMEQRPPSGEYDIAGASDMSTAEHSDVADHPSPRSRIDRLEQRVTDLEASLARLQQELGRNLSD